jgi:hypothetical protein
MPARRGSGVLALGLFLAGVTLVAWDAWRWWRARHPRDDGGYSARADWSARYGGTSHLFGYVWRDRNRDGRQDPGEPPMAGMAAELTSPHGKRNVFRSNLGGFVNATCPAPHGGPVHTPGDYRFRLLVPPEFAVTTGNADQVARGSLDGARPICRRAASNLCRARARTVDLVSCWSVPSTAPPRRAVRSPSRHRSTRSLP